MTQLKSSLLLALLGASFAACGADQTTDDTGETDLGLDGKEDSLSSARSALPAGATHLYFGTENQASVTDDVPLAYRWFTAAAGAAFRVDVDSVDGNGVTTPGVHVGFKLQRAVRQNGRWAWRVVAQGESDSGRATIAYTAPTGPGLYLVTATGAPLPLALNLHLDCGNGACATALQPGASCGGRIRQACDLGTYCAYSLEAQCGAGDQTGTCTIRPNICPRGIRYTPVCGCDGRTYDGGCGAAAAGTSVQRTGPCEVDVVGGWSQVASSGAHYDYTFAADGTFTSTWQPACAFSTPRCYIRIALAKGRYNVYGTNVYLSYDDGVRPGETATFAYQNGGTRLVGTDYGVALSLRRAN